MAMLSAWKVALLMAIATPSAALADEGRIPLTKVLTITFPGHYVVTRDIEAFGSPVFRVAANDVTIDLNGHTLRRSGLGGAVIELSSLELFERRLAVLNGRLAGGGIAAGFPGTSPKSAVGRALVRFENLVITDQGGIAFDPCWEVEMISSRIDGDVTLIGDTGQLAGRLLDNTIRGDVELGALRRGIVRGNVIGGDLRLTEGFVGGQDNLVEGNTVAGVITDAFNGSDHNEIRNNVARGILLFSDGNRVIGNKVRQGAITINGSRNVVEGNSVEGSAQYGVVLGGDNNVYRNNVVHNNGAGGIRSDGSGNVDGGGNIQ
ncbi:MAG TPA: right-handed parallel beta-helix repeat-containing protein [Candidatus Polarisedimenticolaceae bacterium]|nr:right-handed parallel beta-helix repeat-containing protein [Candidatus Polarisedimenticolaceae bacterium]